MSGLAAGNYRSRVTVASKEFAGGVILRDPLVRDLIGNPLLRDHHGEGMTCVFTPAVAACQIRGYADDPMVTPDVDASTNAPISLILAAMLLGSRPATFQRQAERQLAIEADVKRWVLTHQHTDLKDLFQQRVAHKEARRLTVLRSAGNRRTCPNRPIWTTEAGRGAGRLPYERAGLGAVGTARPPQTDRRYMNRVSRIAVWLHHNYKALDNYLMTSEGWPAPWLH